MDLGVVRRRVVEGRGLMSALPYSDGVYHREDLARPVRSSGKLVDARLGSLPRSINGSGFPGGDEVRYLARKSKIDSRFTYEGSFLVEVLGRMRLSADEAFGSGRSYREAPHRG